MRSMTLQDIAILNIYGDGFQCITVATTKNKVINLINDDLSEKSGTLEKIFFSLTCKK